MLIALLPTSALSADDEILKQWQSQKSNTDEWLRQLGVLGDRRIDELFQIRAEAGILALSSPAAETPGGANSSKA